MSPNTCEPTGADGQRLRFPDRDRSAAENAGARLPAFLRLLSLPFAGLPLGPALTLSLRTLARRRPGLFERLGEHASACYFIDPVDLAFAFTVVPDAERSLVRVVRKTDTGTSSVVVRGPLLMLLGLLDGTLDGDALFFNRVISISGRTEAVLALRNAIEDAELRPADLLGLRGAAARLADAGILGGLSAMRHLVASNPPETARK
jgi:predicted lipid carrier protein YhbT